MTEQNEIVENEKSWEIKAKEIGAEFAEYRNSHSKELFSLKRRNQFLLNMALYRGAKSDESFDDAYVYAFENLKAKAASETTDSLEDPYKLLLSCELILALSEVRKLTKESEQLREQVQEMGGEVTDLKNQLRIQEIFEKRQERIIVNMRDDIKRSREALSEVRKELREARTTHAELIKGKHSELKKNPRGKLRVAARRRK
jgi:hypothetical protein